MHDGIRARNALWYKKPMRLQGENTKQLIFLFPTSDWVVNKKRRPFVITEYREWDLFTVSMVTGEKAGHKIIKKCEMRQKLNFTYLFEKFYQFWANIS